VINVGGTRDGNVLAEFGLDGSGLEPTTEVPLAISSKASDIRLSVPKVAPGATAVRLRAAVAAGPAASWLEVSAPRVPRLAPLSSVYPADTPALLDWPVAPLMPCQRIATLAGGLAEMPAFILTAGRSEAEATARSAGGPFAAITDLAEIRPVPTYVDGAPTTWSPQVFAVVPRGPQHTPPTTGSRIERRTAWE
jgi:arabinosyltransferase C